MRVVDYILIFRLWRLRVQASVMGESTFDTLIWSTCLFWGSAIMVCWSGRSSHFTVTYPLPPSSNLRLLLDAHHSVGVCENLVLVRL